MSTHAESGRATIQPTTQRQDNIRAGGYGLNANTPPAEPVFITYNTHARTFSADDYTPRCDRMVHWDFARIRGSTNEHQRSRRACFHTQKRARSGAADPTSKA